MQLKTRLIENKKMREELKIVGMDIGFANGYVGVPVGHELHGIDYNNIEIQAHGG